MKSDRRHNKSVFFRLLVILILLTVLPSAVIGYILYKIARSSRIEQSAVLLNSLAADRALTTRLIIERQRDALGYLAEDPKTLHLARELAGRDSSSGDRFLEEAVRRSAFFVGVSVLDIPTGRNRTAGEFPQEILQRLSLEMRQRPQRAFVRAEALPGGERVLLTGQLIRENGSGSGWVMLGISRFTIFDSLFKDTSMLGATGESFLSDSNGSALTTLRYTSHEQAGHPIDARAMQDCLNGNSKSFVITPDYADVPTAMSYRPVESYGGCVMVHIRASEVMAPVATMRNIVLAIVAAIITAVALTAFLVIRKMLQMERERDRLEENLAEHVSRTEAMVAERTEMNKVLEERTEELVAVNRELEAFSYSVAHDLRTPLRSIDGFAQLLEKNHSIGLDADGRALLSTVQENAKKMGQLIADLLELSRIGRHKIKLQEVNMIGLAGSVIEELKALEPGARVEYAVKTLPSAWAEAVLIRQVFFNLLSNAIKFTRSVENPAIEVGGESRENENIYYVRDNGIGFDAKYSDKIFGIFQRLHNTAEFEGTGVGLAIVERIVQRHGGRVWAEGKVNEGATFYFTIPKGS